MPLQRADPRATRSRDGPGPHNRNNVNPCAGARRRAGFVVSGTRFRPDRSATIIPMSGQSLRVAVLGAGTVGREVVRALIERRDELTVHGRPAFELAGVAVRDVDAAIARGLPPELLTDAPAHLVAGADVVVELMGGDEPARTLIAAALGGGLPVVTANKHVIAHHGAELEAIARRTGAPLRFEASVGGGIPVLTPLARDLAGNRVAAVRGIVNGTTNYILTAMTDEGRDYDEVLVAAQAAGYAEADPTGDVEGHDAVNKLVILVRLAFGVWLEPGDVATTGEVAATGHGRPGITGVTAADIADAAAAGEVVKLLASASRGDGESDGLIEASVVATRVAGDSPLGRTSGVLNRIEVEASPVGTVAFSGPGAGGPATSSAVLGDLLAIAADGGSTWGSLPPARDAVSAGSGS
jgi:homoserine dehydrogenase